MTIHYLDSEATGNGSGTDWTNAFTTFSSAITSISVLNGDTLYISHLTVDDSYSVNTYFVIKDRMIIVSVDKTDDSFKIGAFIENSSGLMDIKTNNADGGSFFVYGVEFKTEDDIYPVAGPGEKAYYEDCAFTPGPGTGDNLYLNDDGATFVTKNCTITLSSGSYIYVSGNGMFNATGLRIFNNTSQTHVFDLGANGGATIRIKDSDLETYTETTSSGMFLNNSDIDDVISIVLSNCRLPQSNVNGIFSGSTVRSNRYCYAYNCTSGGGYIPFMASFREGDVQESGVTPYENSASYPEKTWYSGSIPTEFSYTIYTTSYIQEFVNPLSFKISSIELDLSKSKAFDFSVKQTDSFTMPESIHNKNVWIVASFVYYYNANDEVYPKEISTRAENITSNKVYYQEVTGKWAEDEGEYPQKEQVITINIDSVETYRKIVVDFTLYFSKNVYAADGNGAEDIEFYINPRPTISLL